MQSIQMEALLFCLDLGCATPWNIILDRQEMSKTNIKFTDVYSTTFCQK